MAIMTEQSTGSEGDTKSTNYDDVTMNLHNGKKKKKNTTINRPHCVNQVGVQQMMDIINFK
jgi:hypothetical protein